MKSVSLWVRFVVVLYGLALMPAAWAQAVADYKAPDAWFVYTIIFIILLAIFLVLLMIRNALATTTWSLSDALSEDTEMTAMAKDETGLSKPIMNEAGQPTMITEMRASSSRMIALMGMLVIMLLFIGFGVFAMYSFAVNGSVPDSIDNVVKLLFAGLTLFAPYMVNKFAGVFESISPKK